MEKYMLTIIPPITNAKIKLKTQTSNSREVLLNNLSSSPVRNSDVQDGDKNLIPMIKKFRT